MEAQALKLRIHYLADAVRIFLQDNRGDDFDRATASDWFVRLAELRRELEAGYAHLFADLPKRQPSPPLPEGNVSREDLDRLVKDCEYYWGVLDHFAARDDPSPMQPQHRQQTNPDQTNQQQPRKQIGPDQTNQQKSHFGLIAIIGALIGAAGVVSAALISAYCNKPTVVVASVPELAKSSRPIEAPRSQGDFSVASRWLMCGSSSDCDKTFPVTISARKGDTVTFNMPMGTLDVRESQLEIVDRTGSLIRIKTTNAAN